LLVLPVGACPVLVGDNVFRVESNGLRVVLDGLVELFALRVDDPTVEVGPIVLRIES
jgi:hypothetical protein